MRPQEKARILRPFIEKAAASLSDEDALEAIELFDVWMSGKDYSVDKRVRYNGKLYRVVQAHTSQDNWLPDMTPALFTEVALPGEIPVWKQPIGSQDAYMTGDKVYYPTENDDIYVSIVDNNVWSPDVYGWEKE